MDKKLRNILIIGILIISLSIAYKLIIKPEINEKNFHRCLEIGGNGEIDGRRRWSLGNDPEKYVDYCNKLYRYRLY